MSETKTYKLTVKQQRFIDEYMIDNNATQAAIRAGYSKKTAHVIGIENLRKPSIATMLDSKLQELTLNKGVTVEYLVDVYQQIIRLGLGLQEFPKCTIDREGNVFESNIKELNLPAAKSASDSLGKYLKMFNDDEDTSKNKHELPTINISFPSNGRD